MFVFLNLIAIAALVGIDQAIKLWAVQNLQPVGSMPLIPHVVELHFTYNEGMAFSLLWGRQEILIAATSIGMLLIAWWLFTHCRSDQLQRWALVLVLGGGHRQPDRPHRRGPGGGLHQPSVHEFCRVQLCRHLRLRRHGPVGAVGHPGGAPQPRKQGRQSGRGQVTHGTA